jgi:hypothetical protein
MVSRRGRRVAAALSGAIPNQSSGIVDCEAGGDPGGVRRMVWLRHRGGSGGLKSDPGGVF